MLYTVVDAVNHKLQYTVNPDIFKSNALSIKIWNLKNGHEFLILFC
jgi:hypothetical protein